MSETNPNPKAKEVEHLVVLVHGINTNAQWFPIIKETLEAAGFVAVPAGYGIYGVLRFLVPMKFLRNAAINNVSKKIRLARNHYKPKSVSVIAHSFGTYVVAQIIAKTFDIELNHVIFCGSVVQNDFPFEENLHRFTAPLYNEIGTRDYWPIVASAVTWGYGSVGADGFHNPVVNDRWHKDFKHSDFLTKKFCEEFYIPSLRGEIVAGNRAAPFPFWVQILPRLPVRWFLALVLLVGSVLGSAYIVRNAPPPAELASALVKLFTREPPPPVPEPVWRPVPQGTRYTPLADSVMTLDKVDGAALGWEIGRGQVVPISKTAEQWTITNIKGVEWMRISTPNAGFAYVQKSRLRPVTD